MGSIRKLPVSVVNQIAAGEVIERPASVVKELIENALDAAATEIEVAVEQGGRDLIRIWDNGRGIAADDLPLAVAPHATSKLQTADDLFHVSTFGFRGEALASIASVSHLRLQSRPAGCDAGHQLEIRDGQTSPVVACGCPQGTVVEVRNLFYNTPVRRRYLKANQTEISHVVEIITRVAVAQPHVALRLRHNDKVLFDLPASGRLLERLAAFFGRELAEKLIWIESESAGHRLHGYAADPSYSRSNSRAQYLFVNGRYIRDRSLSHALTEAYRGLLMVGRYPVAFLFFEIPPEEVDVNIHPTKIEVRFRDPQQHFRQLLGTLRQKFLASDLTPRLEITYTPPTATDAAADSEFADTAAAAAAESNLRAFFGRAAAEPPASGRVDDDDGTPPTPSFQLRPPPAPTPTLPFGRDHTATRPLAPMPSPTPAPAQLHHDDRPAGPAPPATRPDAPAALVLPAAPTPAAAGAAMQVHNSFIVVETLDGLMVIDQHALHERVLYEEIRTRVLAGNLESQRLLVPEVVELSAAEVALVTDHSEVLEQLGMNAEPFGGTSVALHTYPAMLANLPADRMFRDVVDCLAGGAATPSRRDLLDSLLHMISCKAAIKAGQRLTPDEIQSLVSQHHLAQDSHHCPHGRPTALMFSKSDLEKQFKRT